MPLTVEHAPAMKVFDARPDALLRPFIRAYVQREAHLGVHELVEPVIARLGVMLEFEFAGAYEVLNYGSNKVDATFPVTVIGPQTWRRCRLIIRDHVESLVVMFQPSGFHALFGTPTSPLSELGTDGIAVIGSPISRLHQRLGNLADFSERVRLLDRYFLHRLRHAASIEPMHKALQLLTLPGARFKVDDVARLAGVSIRSLERRSLEYSGVPPKELRRISRFNRALQFRSDTAMTWAEIAQASDYHDQMHLIRDFRVFAGGAPTSALQEIERAHLIHFCAD